MVKKLIVVGNSLGLIIERPILELLKIDKETPLEISIDGEALIIRPARNKRPNRIKAAASKLMDANDQTMRKLAQ